MKKVLFVMALALMNLSMNAQDGLKGTWFAGGQLSYGQTKAGSDKVNNTMILPIIGTFVSPDVAIGAGLGYIGGKNYNEDKTAKLKTNSFVFKPLVRKYWNITGGLFFYGQAALPVIIGNVKVDGADGKTNTTAIGLELSPGFDYVINSWLTIETSFTIFSMGYNRAKVKGGDAATTFEINANPFNSIGDREVGALQVGVKFLF